MNELNLNKKEQPNSEGKNETETNFVMKYCSHCGNELTDKSDICHKCGYQSELHKKEESSITISNLKIAAKIFMILGCVLSVFCFLIPLAWTIPMTVSYCKKIKHGVRVSVGFKVCSFLFVSEIGGFLMLIDKD